MNARADSGNQSPRIRALVERTEGADRASRIAAFVELARLKAKGAGKGSIARMKSLAPADAEAAAILAYWEASGEPNTAPAAARWLASVTPEKIDPLPESLSGADAVRSLRIASSLAGKAAYQPETALALARLGSHPELEVARTALEALAQQEEAKEKALVAPLISALARPELEPQALALLSRIGSIEAVPAIIASAERFQRANPRQGAPDHAEALRAITKQKLGDDATEWKRWWSARR